MYTTENQNEIPQQSSPSTQELHAFTVEQINEANQLLFKAIPHAIDQIISNELWTQRNIDFKNFAEYALHSAPEGLGIANNKMLWLLKSTMKHTTQWAEIVEEVEVNVRDYAKDHKIPIRELQGSLGEYEGNVEEGFITYLPSRSNSDDSRLLKLKNKDPQAYEDVLHNKVKLKEALHQLPKKRLEPIEAVKNKFTRLSKDEREAFLSWLEQEKDKY